MNDDTNSSMSVQDGVHHSKPIPISTQHLRHRSASLSSDSTTSSASSPPLITPNNLPNARFPPSASSPIFQFLSQSSPTKTPATFPYRGLVPPPVIEGVWQCVISRRDWLTPLCTDEPPEEYSPLAQHARRASTASRFQPQPPVLEPHHERGVNVLRRLSLGGIRKVCWSYLRPTNASDVS